MPVSPKSPKSASGNNMRKALVDIQDSLQASFEALEKSIYNDKDTYSGSWPTHVTRVQAEKHVKMHMSEGPDKGENHWQSFLKEVGDKPKYHKDEVLGWLGY